MDGSVWTSKYDKNNNRTTDYIWKYDLIIEHENYGLDWLNEMQKLCSINAKSKLIITYGRTKDDSKHTKNTKDVKGVNLLPIAEEIIEFTNDNSFDEFVIMFGEENCNLDKIDEKSLFDIYSYDKTKGKFIIVLE